MSLYFNNSIIISQIHYSTRGYTQPGKYHYKNRSAYELGFRIFGESVSSAQDKVFTVNKNCVVFKPKGVEDICETKSGVEYCSVWFSIEGDPQFDFNVFRPNNPEKILENFKSLIKEEQHNGINLKCYALLYDILHLLNYSESYSSAKNRSLIQEIMQHIETNFKNSEFGVNDILEHFGISASFLRKLFHSKFSKSPLKYLIEKRIDYSKRLLLYSNSSVNEISEASGFNSPFYFSRIFKKYTSLSPLRFREENY